MNKKADNPKDIRKLLLDHVYYFQNLNKNDQDRFEQMIVNFFSYVSIEGVNTNATDLDKVLVAASAIIPVFHFEKWKYYQLSNVLLYPDTFNREEFLQEGYEKDVLGMVGNGPLQRTMILSKPALHAGFRGGRHNTGIHEFVHLIDKEDGSIDGLPEALLGKSKNAEWIRLQEQSIHDILSGESDISSYGATNKAEFFPVAAEYFFNDPETFSQKHPQLFKMMKLIFAIPENS
jgi:hypothetical protein